MPGDLGERVADQRLGLGLVAQGSGVQLGDLDQRRGLRLGAGKERDATLQPQRARPGVAAASREVGQLGGGVDVGRELERPGERRRRRRRISADVEEQPGPAALHAGCVPGTSRTLESGAEAGQRLERIVGPVRPAGDVGDLLQHAGDEGEVSAAEHVLGDGLQRGEQRAGTTGLAVQRRPCLVRGQGVG